MRHQVQWTAPAPLLGRAPDLSETGRIALRRPAILRFASDSFMEEFHRALETDPSKLAGLEVQYETWRGPGVSAPAVPQPARGASRMEQKLARMKVSAERRLSMFGGPGGVALAEPPATTVVTVDRDQTSATRTLKLYQPAHQRFYLVTAALVCRRPGLPDRAVDAARQEKTTFVVRRVRTTTDSATNTTRRAEYGFIAGSGGGSWRLIASPDAALAPGEEKLPLFAVNFQDDGEKKRRVLAGLVPAGRRDTYVGASEQSSSATPAPVDTGTGNAADPGAPPPPVDPRIALLSADVIEPWKALVLGAAKTAEQIANTQNVGHPMDGAHQASRENIQVGSWYVLLDFATFLDRQLKPVWLAIKDGATPPEQAQLDVVNAIKGALRPASPNFSLQTPATLADALKAVTRFRTPLEQASGDFSFTTHPTVDWPDFVFALADAELDGPVPAVTLPPLPAGAKPLTPTQTVLRKISALRDLIAAALPATPTDAVPDLPLAAQPVMAPDETALFVVRCVFERPECGPINPPLLSAPSREFELAGFFDPDAPARPIRIALPVDTSPAGLRRAPKNTAFMVSDMLCGQINRAKGLGLVDLVMSVLPFPLHKDLDSGGPTPCKTDTNASLGMICSLSIPIVTICALILLIIMVSILDYIFRWLPYFIFCFPLPKFSAKPPPQPSQP